MPAEGTGRRIRDARASRPHRVRGRRVQRRTGTSQELPVGGAGRTVAVTSHFYEQATGVQGEASGRCSGPQSSTSSEPGTFVAEEEGYMDRAPRAAGRGPACRNHRDARVSGRG